MRITSGEFGGRLLKVPKTGDVRPTQDRVREALFSMLQTHLAGADFLDLFAGTGSVGLEAISRGAKSATFVEINPKHLAILGENAKMASGKAAAVKTVRMDAVKFVANYSGGGFDIVFADPPYLMGETMGYGEMLQNLMSRNVVKPGGLFIAEMTSAQAADRSSGWELVRERTYGKTRLAIWKRDEGENEK